MPRILLFLICAALASCNAPSTTLEPKRKFISIPPPGVEKTANLGDYLLMQGYFLTSDGIEVSQATKAKLDGMISCFVIQPGKYARVGLGDDLDYFSIVDGLGGIKYEGPICKESNPPNYIAVNRKTGELAVIDSVGQYIEAEASPFVRTEVSVATEADFQQVLVYNGKQGDYILVGYREFSNNMARSAFSNEVRYDLSESNLVGYKAARLRIIRATNTDITYVVEEGFQEPSR